MDPELKEEHISLLPLYPPPEARTEPSPLKKEPEVPKVSVGGFSTRQALAALGELIDYEQTRFRAELRWQKWLKDALLHTSERGLFNWTEILLLLLQAVLVVVTLVAAAADPAWRIFMDRSEATAVLAILLGFVVLNVWLACWEARGRHLELWTQVDCVAEQIRRDLQPLTNKKSFEWKTSHYPSLQSPDSPCITLQWTYRDEALVALPAILLVPRDIILVRPSQKVACLCMILPEDADETTKDLRLQAGEAFQPDAEGELENPVGPKERVAAEAKRFVVLEAPFRQILLESLSGKALQRPSSVVEKQRRLIGTLIVRWVLPTAAVLYLVGNLVELFVFPNSGYEERWAEEFLYGNLYVLLPLSPLVFPSLWLGVNYIILARVLSVYQKFRRKKFKHDFLHEAKLTDAIYIVKADWFSTWARFRSFLEGNSESLFQTSNIVHTLGNVTAVCCMDKKGILSWPNPNAEKICVLRARAESVSASKASLRQSASSLQETVYITEEAQIAKNFDRHNSLSAVAYDSQSAVPEILDMTQSGGRAFDIEFDDPSWTKVLNSLKPLGLGILLNTCNEEVQEYYRTFTDHVSCVANHHDQTVPVVNRRCLCSLSHTMGFTPSAQRIFKQIHEMAFYRKPMKTPRELEGRYKSPFPNMLSIVVQDKKSGGLQVMSQGTADLILDTCTDYWNGQEVRPMTDDDRKHILEFYTRFSMTAYCTAFCYSPLAGTVPEQSHESDSDSDADDTFIELPVEDDITSNHEVSSQVSGEADSERVEDLFDNCCRSQVFLGCVAQQYQSRNEFVHLIDLLEQSCIRFIHFSPETELRSRVFAERLGLESGWNCHISLDSKGIDPTLIEPEVPSFTPPITSTRKGMTTIVVEPEINLENRARLPRGIENMRKHIAEVDNVPLLVSLFTDCIPASIREMLEIMQENGEVVCCLGSSANLSNASVFMQADASIAIEPMYPQLCRNSRIFNPTGDRKLSQCLPTELMRTLTSLNCSLSCQKEDPLSLMQLVIESRHNLSVLRNCFKFLISAGLALVLLNSLANLLCLPPVLSLGHLLLLVCLSLPLLSVSLLAAPHDRNLMRISTGKNRAGDLLNRDIILRFTQTFLLRWLPSVFIVLLCQALLLSESCRDGGSLSCYPVLGHLSQPKVTLRLTQNFAAVLVVLYFSLISMGYGNGRPGFWRYSSVKNQFWLVALLGTWLLQLVYCFADLAGMAGSSAKNETHDGVATNESSFSLLTGVDDEKNSTDAKASVGPRGASLLAVVPYWVWLVGFLWPLFLLPLNELIKRFELAELDKQQKRARLQFGTKLGMNSPF
ncbi:Transmembrane protein 94 [Hypsibius exemplaris]|uniref:Transmembrane protein 94 n=1 Tax=Hypsibius exemplaris TaxID=2072580 RepID=A0A1W0WP76_HYPEX|nr:Transmembrane protein 94 [Hypsibius exemplaris]